MNSANVRQWRSVREGERWNGCRRESRGRNRMAPRRRTSVQKRWYSKDSRTGGCQELRWMSRRVNASNRSHPDDETCWVRSAQAGDRGAFAQLVERYWDRLYRWLYHLAQDRHTAEDLTQETFLKALAGLDSFRAGSNFRAWLFRIGHNNFVNRKRSERHGNQPLPEDVSGTVQVRAEVAAEQREWLERVESAVANLPLDFRAALLLRVYEGLSFREVARILRTTEETARWRVFKARQLLLQQLAPELLPPEARDGPATA